MKQSVRGPLISSINRIRRHRPEDAIVLSCDPRSGSTWLGELLSKSEATATVWEPYHLDEAPKVRDFGFSWRQYIPANADWPEARALNAQILSGHHMNHWTGSATPFGEYLAAKRLIIKCCRATGFLPWLTRNFNFERKPIYFVRHPFAIAASQLKMGNFGTKGMDEALAQGRYSDDLKEASDYIRSLKTDEERIVGMWCRTHLPCLTDKEADKYWTTVSYEQLTLDPRQEIDRIFTRWSLTPPEELHLQSRSASRMTQDNLLETNPLDQVSKWKSNFSDEQISAMLRVLQQFEIKIYNDSPLPQIGAD